MAGRLKLGGSTYDIALKRMVEQYEEGHRVVVSISGGKDSTCCLELCVQAARLTGCLPVDAVTRDEEIMFPGTYEYLERCHDRTDEINLKWLVANQPIINAFDRASPYWWVFDPLLDPDDWVRQPPPYAEHIKELHIASMTSSGRFPTAPGQEMRGVIGIRTGESVGRLMGAHSMGGFITTTESAEMARRTASGEARRRDVWPIYDWEDGDVWLAIQKFGWDYNHAYDVMLRHGIPKRRLRIGPPTMNPAGGDALRDVGQVAWPAWWNRVCRRLPSVRTYAKYGKRAVTPIRRYGETWEECFQRVCIDTAPKWIAERATFVRDRQLAGHAKHSRGQPFPEVKGCRGCQSEVSSWATLARNLYLGDPFSMKMVMLPIMEPEFFRPGAGYWEGRPSF